MSAIGEVVASDRFLQRYGAKFMDMEFLPPGIYIWPDLFPKGFFVLPRYRLTR